MEIFRVLTNQELRQALAHVHDIVRVTFAERDGDAMGAGFHDMGLLTVGRFIDSLPYDAPGAPCRVAAGGTGSAPVVGVLLDRDGVQLLLDRAQAGPSGDPGPRPEGAAQEPDRGRP